MTTNEEESEWSRTETKWKFRQKEK